MLALLSLVGIGDLLLLVLISASVTVEGSWASFAPDLLVGLVTTGGLGLALYFYTQRLERSFEERASRRALLNDWFSKRLELGQARAIDEFARPSLDSLSDLALGNSLAVISPKQLIDWTGVAKGDSELSCLVRAATNAAYARQFGLRLEARIAALAVRGKIQNANDPADVAMAVRAMVLTQTQAFEARVGAAAARLALDDAERIVDDPDFQKYASRYQRTVAELYDDAAKWSAENVKASLHLLSQRA